MTDDNDLFGGRRARDYNLSLCSEAQFFRNADSILPEYKGQEIITEDVKIRMQLRGYPLPPSHQSWGSWTMAARKRGAIVPVRGPDGKHKLRQCRKKESHARDSKVYRVR